MTMIWRTKESFASDALSGFCELNPTRVRRVSGGVVRASSTSRGKVAVVVGGGSGHYPAFAGYVGTGLADGAACGDVFASPSARDVENVALTVERGAGVLLTFGNYMGDLLNFGLAAQRLRDRGVGVCLLPVTDDVASAPPDQAGRRRGIAGDVVVFKVAGAAAEAGYDLAGVERVARTANNRTRSVGVAFSGCTLPGASSPLFDVPEGSMAVGLGIHGEPGIDVHAIMRADALANLLVERVMAEVAEDGECGGPRRVAAILNGLGASKYEELFVLWHHTASRLRKAGLEIVRPEVGELVTSLDMAGCSLTLSWLDDEMAELWEAPASSVAFQRSALHPRHSASGRSDNPASGVNSQASDQTPAGPSASDVGFPPALPAPSESAESRAVGARLVTALGYVVEALTVAEEELGQIDAAAGDGDHGRGMLRGSRAALEAATAARDLGAGAASVLVAASDGWADSGGGTSGILWGVGLRAAAETLSDSSGSAELVASVEAAVQAVMSLGGAVPGDKTLVDALVPFATTLADEVAAGVDPLNAWRSAASAAEGAAQATAELRPRVGRARPLAERSIGHPDAGAVSLACCVRAVARAGD